MLSESHVLKEGEISARFAPAKGMNLLSLKKGDLEIIDQSTLPFFQDRNAGLGAMIGPHFYHRTIIPAVKNPEKFPHIAKSGVEPFSHGIGRYAPWKVESASQSHIKASLSGKDTWCDTTLAELEGQNFNMTYGAKIHTTGLAIDLSVSSDTGSVVGLHTYYALKGKANRVKARVKNEYNDQGVIKKIPDSWNYDAEGNLTYNLDNTADFGFYPLLDPLSATIRLETDDHVVEVFYRSPNSENLWQLWHPENASFVCIEPLSAREPRKPHLSTSSIHIEIRI